MSFESLKVIGSELITTWKEKFNTLVNRTFYNVDLVNNKTLRFYRTDGLDVDIELPNLGSGTGGGTPEDNDYDSNFFISDGDSYHDGLQKLDAILGALSPTPAEVLTGHDLGYDGELVFFSAKLPSGLDAKWYPSGVQAGDTISRYIVDNTYTIYTPGNTFRAGKYNEPIGKVVHVVNGSDVVSLTLTTGQVSNSASNAQGTSNFQASTSQYNNIWQRGSASVYYTQTAEGYLRHSIKHIDENSLPISGESNGFVVWYDNVNAQPTFAAAPTHTANPQWKYLSGIQYYGLNTVIIISYVGVSVFKNGYHPTAVSTVTSSFFPTQTVNPISVPATNSNFSATRPLTLSNPNQSSGLANGVLTVNLYRPSGKSASISYSLDKRVCTYDIASTPTSEYFYDEAKRLINSTYNSFSSNAALDNGHAQVANGNLIYGNNDYTNKSGDQEYQRFFNKVAASNGLITFAGIAHTDVSAYGTGDLNILLYLEGSKIFFDMGIPYGAGGNGGTRATAMGCKRGDASSGSTIGFTFGLDSTANPGNNDKYRVIIIFKDTNNSKSMRINSVVTN